MRVKLTNFKKINLLSDVEEVGKYNFNGYLFHVMIGKDKFALKYVQMPDGKFRTDLRLKYICTNESAPLPDITYFDSLPDIIDAFGEIIQSNVKTEPIVFKEETFNISELVDISTFLHDNFTNHFHKIGDDTLLFKINDLIFYAKFNDHYCILYDGAKTKIQIKLNTELVLKKYVDKIQSMVDGMETLSTTQCISLSLQSHGCKYVSYKNGVMALKSEDSSYRILLNDNESFELKLPSDFYDNEIDYEAASLSDFKLSELDMIDINIRLEKVWESYNEIINKGYHKNETLKKFIHE